jgi:hypothetical protein
MWSCDLKVFFVAFRTGWRYLRQLADCPGLKVCRQINIQNSKSKISYF